jgi:hypothetical protein
MKLRVASAALLSLLVGCHASVGPGPIHSFQVESIALDDISTFETTCRRDLTGAVTVQPTDLFRDPSAYDRRVVTLTGNYVLTETQSELRLDGHAVWIDGAHDPGLTGHRVTVTGIFTTQKTAPERPAATLCGVTSIRSAR